MRFDSETNTIPLDPPFPVSTSPSIHRFRGSARGERGKVGKRHDFFFATLISYFSLLAVNERGDKIRQRVSRIKVSEITASLEIEPRQESVEPLFEYKASDACVDLILKREKNHSGCSMNAIPVDSEIGIFPYDLVGRE